MTSDRRNLFLLPAALLTLSVLLAAPAAHAADAAPAAHAADAAPAAHAVDIAAPLDTDALSADTAPDTSHVLVALDAPATPLTVTLASFRPDADAAADVSMDDTALAGTGAVLQTGTASWYGSAWSGRRTASGTRFNPEEMTAASHTLPLGTRVLVTLVGTARSVLVTITDHQGTARRVIDLSAGAARKIGMMGMGVAQVVLRRV